jgi:hypothetical protein
LSKGCIPTGTERLFTSVDVIPVESIDVRAARATIGGSDPLRDPAVFRRAKLTPWKRV